MPLPTGFYCRAIYTVGGWVAIGPGVTDASGLPTGLSFPGTVYGDGYIDGYVTTVGVYEGTVNGVGFRWRVSPDSSVVGFVPEYYRPSLVQYVPVTGSMSGTGGTPPYSFRVQDPTYCDQITYPDVLRWGLPTGVILNSDGSFSGTPTESGLWTPIFEISDSAGRGSWELYTGAQWSVSPGTPPGPIVLSPATASLILTGGTPTRPVYSPTAASLILTGGNPTHGTLATPSSSGRIRILGGSPSRNPSISCAVGTGSEVGPG